MAKKKRIKKLWCTYRYLTHSGVARIERDSGDVVWIRYSDGRSPFPWEKRYTRRFDTLFGAILEMGKSGDSSILLLSNRVARYFPSEAENIRKAYEKYAKTAK